MSGVETVVAPSAASGRRWSTMLMMATLLVAGTLTGTAVAQETTQPVDPVGTERGMVRFVNLSPNASPATLSLSDNDGAVVAPTEFEGLSFGAETDYLPVPVGGYDMTFSVGDGISELPPGFTSPYVTAAPNRLNVTAGGYHTVVLIGLLIPENFADDDGAGDGFVGWLRGLFGGDSPADRDSLALRAEVLDDDLSATFDADQARVRVVHAAPGASDVDLVSSSDRGVVASGIAFGDVSGYHTLAATELGLSLRGAGSEAEVADLSTQTLSVGASHTVFLIGTPFEDVPLEVRVFTGAPVAAPQ